MSIVQYFLIFKILKTFLRALAITLLNAFAVVFYLVIFAVANYFLRAIGISVFYSVFMSLIVAMFMIFTGCHGIVEQKLSLACYAGRIAMGIGHILCSVLIGLGIGGILPTQEGWYACILIIIVMTTISFREYLKRLTFYYGQFSTITVTEWLSRNFP
jgi:hypothetical protein